MIQYRTVKPAANAKVWMHEGSESFSIVRISAPSGRFSKKPDSLACGRARMKY